MKFRIATLNTWGLFGPFEARWEILAGQLRALDCQALCLQEVTDNRLISKIAGVTHLKHSAFFPPPGLAILSSAPIETQDECLFHNTSPTEEYPRGALFVTTRIGTQNFAIACTHLSWKEEDQSVRSGQVEELIRLAGRVPVPAVLAGDFNDVPGSPPIKKIRDAGYRDLFFEDHPHETGITWDNRNPFIQSHRVKFSDRRIDFLFAKKELLDSFVLRACGRVFDTQAPNGFFASDHYGVLAELETR